jgi:hypothetical protein
VYADNWQWRYFMTGDLGSIFLLQINSGPESVGWSLIPGIPNHYISASYARLVMDLAGRARTVAFIVAAVLLAVSLAVNGSGWLIKDLNIKEVLRSAVITVSLLVIWTPTFGFLMSFGYHMGEFLVDEKKVTNLLENAFRQTPNGELPGQTAGKGPADGGASDVKSGGWLSWLLDVDAGFTDLITTSLAAVVSVLCMLLFMIAAFVMPSIWLVFATLLFIFGPLVISLGMLPRIGGKILGNLFGSLFELSLWQAWFHICAWLVMASNDLVGKKVTDFFFNSENGAQAVDAAYTSAEAAAMGLVFAGLYFATPLVVRHLVPVSQFGATAALIINKASSIATIGAGMVTGGAGGAAAGAGKYMAGKTGLEAVLGGVRGAVSGGLSGAVSSTRSGYQIMRGIRSVNPPPEKVTKSAGKSA